MKQVTGAIAALLVLATALPAAAQQAPTTGQTSRSVGKVVEESGIVPAVESLAVSVTPELERALNQLAASLTLLAARIAADPELRTSAARAGRGMADVAEAAVIEQSSALQEALRALADRLEAIANERERRD